MTLPSSFNCYDYFSLASSVISHKQYYAVLSITFSGSCQLIKLVFMMMKMSHGMRQRDRVILLSFPYLQVWSSHTGVVVGSVQPRPSCPSSSETFPILLTCPSGDIWGSNVPCKLLKSLFAFTPFFLKIVSELLSKDYHIFGKATVFVMDVIVTWLVSVRLG